MAGNGRRVAGFVAIVIAVLAGVVDIVFYMGLHPRRGIVVLIACGVLLILGIVLVAVSRRRSS
jgi:hypothetical protein